MAQVAVVTGADRGLGRAMCAELLERGWRVVAGQFMTDWPELGELKAKFPERLMIVPLNVRDMESVRAAAAVVEKDIGHVDVLINNAGIISKEHARTIRDGQDYPDIAAQYDVNAIGPIRMVECFLPLVERGSMRRLCFVSSEAGSIARSTRTSWYGYCMSKAALNMGVRILFNDLRPQGFTFRVYHPGWVRSYMSGKKNLAASLEPEEAARAALAYFLNSTPLDEDRLVLRDYQGQEWPW